MPINEAELKLNVKVEDLALGEQAQPTSFTLKQYIAHRFSKVIAKWNGKILKLTNETQDLESKARTTNIQTKIDQMNQYLANDSLYENLLAFFRQVMAGDYFLIFDENNYPLKDSHGDKRYRGVEKHHVLLQKEILQNFIRSIIDTKDESYTKFREGLVRFISKIGVLHFSDLINAHKQDYGEITINESLSLLVKNKDSYDDVVFSADELLKIYYHKNNKLVFANTFDLLSYVMDKDYDSKQFTDLITRLQDPRCISLGDAFIVSLISALLVLVLGWALTFTIDNGFISLGFFGPAITGPLVFLSTEPFHHDNVVARNNSWAMDQIKKSTHLLDYKKYTPYLTKHSLKSEIEIVELEEVVTHESTPLLRHD